jgi:hypothetical protein
LFVKRRSRSRIKQLRESRTDPIKQKKDDTNRRESCEAERKVNINKNEVYGKNLNAVSSWMKSDLNVFARENPVLTCRSGATAARRLTQTGQ